jgi:hypothetical protein
VDIIPVFLDSFLRFFEHDKKHGFLIVEVSNFYTSVRNFLYYGSLWGSFSEVYLKLMILSCQTFVSPDHL